MDDPMTGLEALGWDDLMLEDMALQLQGTHEPEWDISSGLQALQTGTPEFRQPLGEQTRLDGPADQSTYVSLAEAESAGSTPKACLDLGSPEALLETADALAEVDGLASARCTAHTQPTAAAIRAFAPALPMASGLTQAAIRRSQATSGSEKPLSQQIADFLSTAHSRGPSQPAEPAFAQGTMPASAMPAAHLPASSLWPFPFAFKQRLPFGEPLSPTSGLSSGSSSSTTLLSDFLSKSFFPGAADAHPLSSGTPQGQHSPRIRASPAGGGLPPSGRPPLYPARPPPVPFSQPQDLTTASLLSEAVLAPGSGHHALQIPADADASAPDLACMPDMQPDMQLPFLDDPMTPLPTAPLDWPGLASLPFTSPDAGLDLPLLPDWDAIALGQAHRPSRPLQGFSSLPPLKEEPDNSGCSSMLHAAGGAPLNRSHSARAASDSGEFSQAVPAEDFAEGPQAGAQWGVRHSSRQHTAPKWVTDSDSLDAMDDRLPPPPKKEAKRVAAAMKAPHCSTKAGRKRLAVEHISLELLQQGGYFDMPIQEAAQQLKVGLSVLKRICRQMGLARWPFRTRQSLRGVIAKTQEYYQGGEEAGEGVQKADVVQALESTLEQLQGVPGQGLSESVRKYRQSVFKLNYKIKKHKSGGTCTPAAAKDAPPPASSSALPAIPATAAARVANADGTPSGSSPADPQPTGVTCEAGPAATLQTLLAQGASGMPDGAVAGGGVAQPASGMGLSDNLAAALGMHAQLQPQLQGLAQSLAAAAGMPCTAGDPQLSLQMQLAMAAAATASGVLPASLAAALPSSTAGAAAMLSSLPLPATQDLSMASLLTNSSDLPL